jgi:transposase, IS5 family
MYRQTSPGQLSFENFYLPFGGKLSGENRWVKLAAMMPWEAFESSYAAQFSEGRGAPAKSFRMALGALIIKERLGVSDEETVEQVRENPYLQYFLGLSEYSDRAPFDASMMTHFRQRLSLEIVSQVNEAVVEAVLVPEAASVEATEAEATPPASSEVDASDNAADDAGPSSADDDPPNQGQLLLDATVAPADIHYPTDLHLLNQARASSERILDQLWATMRQPGQRKPRTYRQQARRNFLKVAKQRRPSRRQIRKAIGQQLRYLRRNLEQIRQVVAAGARFNVLAGFWYQRLLVIQEVYRQQWLMYHQRQHRVEHRIVSLAQPHVRPIVRGKAGTPVEFGAKLAVSCVQGFCFIDHLDWEAFNEALDLPRQVERYQDRFGVYPESVHADAIYRTRANRQWCKARGIRLSGPPLGRPAATAQPDLERQAQQDARIRNAIEGKFGQGKRRFSLNRVMAKLPHTAATAMAITVLVMNLERRLRPLFLFFASFRRCYAAKGACRLRVLSDVHWLVGRGDRWPCWQYRWLA